MRGSLLPGAAASETRETEGLWRITTDPGWHSPSQSFRHGAALSAVRNYRKIVAILPSSATHAFYVQSTYKARTQKRGPLRQPGESAGCSCDDLLRLTSWEASERWLQSATTATMREDRHSVFEHFATSLVDPCSALQPCLKNLSCQPREASNIYSNPFKSRTLLSPSPITPTILQNRQKKKPKTLGLHFKCLLEVAPARICPEQADLLLASAFTYHGPCLSME